MFLYKIGRYSGDRVLLLERGLYPHYQDNSEQRSMRNWGCPSVLGTDAMLAGWGILVPTTESDGNDYRHEERK